MSENPLDELPSDRDVVEAIIEAIAFGFDAVPLVVWTIVAGVLLLVAFNRMGERDHDTADSDDDRYTSQPREPSRERYSIHDDIDVDRDYEQPSESDDIVVPNEVDHGLFGTIKRLLGVGRSADDDDQW